MKQKSPLDCVHCPHCDLHLCLWGDVQKARAAAGEAAKGGAWTVCPKCCYVIHVTAEGEHVAPTSEQVEATTPEVQAAIGAQVWMAKTARDALARGLMVSFAPIEGSVATYVAAEERAPSSFGSSSRH